MDEKDISIIQDSRIAIQVLNKMVGADKGFNFIYIDGRHTDVDNRRLTQSQPQHLATSNNNRKMIPNVTPSSVGKIPEHILSDFESAVMQLPDPKLDHAIKALFLLAEKRGKTDKEKANFLGIERGKMHYWRRKLKIGGGKK